MMESENNNGVNEVETPPVEVGSFVAVYLANWNLEPALGRVTKTPNKYFHIEYYKEVDQEWQPWIVKINNSNIVWTQKLSRDCIVLSNFELDNNHLAMVHREYIMRRYKEINASKQE